MRLYFPIFLILLILIQPSKAIPPATSAYMSDELEISTYQWDITSVNWDTSNGNYDENLLLNLEEGLLELSLYNDISGVDIEADNFNITHYFVATINDKPLNISADNVPVIKFKKIEATSTSSMNTILIAQANIVQFNGSILNWEEGIRYDADQFPDYVTLIDTTDTIGWSSKSFGTFIFYKDTYILKEGSYDTDNFSISLKYKGQIDLVNNSDSSEITSTSLLSFPNSLVLTSLFIALVIFKNKKLIN